MCVCPGVCVLYECDLCVFHLHVGLGGELKFVGGWIRCVCVCIRLDVRRKSRVSCFWKQNANFESGPQPSEMCVVS